MFAGVLILLVSLTAADEPAEKQELEKLQGTWITVSTTVRGGKAVFDERTRDFRTIIEENKIIALRGSEKQQICTFRIDPTKSPKQMDLLFERDGQTTVNLGIYKLEGDTLTVCNTFVGGERPERFEPTEDNSLSVLKRDEK